MVSISPTPQARAGVPAKQQGSLFAGNQRLSSYQGLHASNVSGNTSVRFGSGFKTAATVGLLVLSTVGGLVTPQQAEAKKPATRGFNATQAFGKCPVPPPSCPPLQCKPKDCDKPEPPVCEKPGDKLARLQKELAEKLAFARGMVGVQKGRTELAKVRGDVLDERLNTQAVQLENSDKRILIADHEVQLAKGRIKELKRLIRAHELKIDGKILEGRELRGAKEYLKTLEDWAKGLKPCDPSDPDIPSDPPDDPGKPDCPPDKPGKPDKPKCPPPKAKCKVWWWKKG